MVGENFQIYGVRITVKCIAIQNRLGEEIMSIPKRTPTCQVYNVSGVYFLPALNEGKNSENCVSLFILLLQSGDIDQLVQNMSIKNVFCFKYTFT